MLVDSPQRVSVTQVQTTAKSKFAVFPRGLFAEFAHASSGETHVGSKTVLVDIILSVAR